jgi:hypothetical protein
MNVLKEQSKANLELLSPEYHCNTPLSAEHTLLLYSIDPFGLRQLYFCLTNPQVCIFVNVSAYLLVLI